jgi:hypothetical protein
MPVTTWAGHVRQSKRRRRSTELFVESIEMRLAPSPTLPLPPPHVASLVAEGLPQGFPSASGGMIAAVHDQPPDPCRDQPPDPC